MLKLGACDKMFFANDEEFYKFCVVPKLIICQEPNSVTGEIEYYTDFDFTNEYKDALTRNRKFVICDDNSQIFKHGCVSYRTITKPIDNLYKYHKKYGNNKLTTE